MKKKTTLSFGRRYAPDARDKKYRLKKVATERTRRMWRSNWDNADQGNEPACVGYACAGWLASQPINQFLDPLWIYRYATYRDEWPYEDWENSEGTSVRAGMKLLKDFGFIAEYRWAATVKDLLPHVLEVSPVVVGTAWYTGMCEPDSKGFISVTGMAEGGHAYIWNGADTKKGIARIKNSWSAGWGDKGHAWITLDDLDLLLKEEGEACAGIEIKPTA